MRYNNLIPHWYKVDHKFILIDHSHTLIGHFELIPNQLHHEYARDAKNNPRKGVK